MLSGSKAISLIEVAYNSESGSWEVINWYKTGMSVNRMYHKGVYNEGKFYIISGFDSESQNYISKCESITLEAIMNNQNASAISDII